MAQARSGAAHGGLPNRWRAARRTERNGAGVRPIFPENREKIAEEFFLALANSHFLLTIQIVKKNRARRIRERTGKYQGNTQFYFSPFWAAD
jgi:hypothetical protein